MSAILARLMRDKKILKQADERTKLKAACLKSEMEAARELGDEDYPIADAIVGLSPTV